MKILVLDSGVGGRVVENYLKHMLDKKHKIKYISDSENVPYGSKSTEEILSLTDKMIAPYKGKYDILVPACNTISCAMIRHKVYDEKTIDIIRPTIKILENQNLKNLAVICTPYTHNSGIYQKKLRCLSLPCANLARYVEDDDYIKIVQEVERITNYLIKRNINRIILGCTHYEKIDYIFRNVAPQLEFLYPGKYQAQYVLKRVLKLEKNV